MGVGVLAEVMVLNHLQMAIEDIVEQKAMPPLAWPARMFPKPLDRRPGAPNAYNPAGLGIQSAKDAIIKLDLTGDPSGVLEHIKYLTEVVERGYFVDWMNLRESGDMTAEEVTERRDIRLRGMASIVSNCEMPMTTLGDRTLDGLKEEMMLPRPVPAGVAGALVDWEYAGPLAIAQLRGNVQSLLQLIQARGLVAGPGPGGGSSGQPRNHPPSHPLRPRPRPQGAANSEAHRPRLPRSSSRRSSSSSPTPPSSRPSPTPPSRAPAPPATSPTPTPRSPALVAAGKAALAWPQARHGGRRGRPLRPHQSPREPRLRRVASSSHGGRDHRAGHGTGSLPIEGDGDPTTRRRARKTSPSAGSSCSRRRARRDHDLRRGLRRRRPGVPLAGRPGAAGEGGSGAGEWSVRAGPSIERRSTASPRLICRPAGAWFETDARDTRQGRPAGVSHHDGAPGRLIIVGRRGPPLLFETIDLRGRRRPRRR